MKGILNSKELEHTENIIIGGYANSRWRKKDTYNLETNIDKSIRIFCEEMGLIDIMRQKRKRIYTPKEKRRELNTS
jgi:hypothetical protein